MLIFLILFFLIALGAYITIKLEPSGNDIFGIFIVLPAFICLIVAIIILPVNYYSEKANIEKFKITEQTYQVARKNLKNNQIIENAAIQMDIAKQNRWLVRTQYWNNTIFDLWFPDQIEKLKPIQ